MQDKYCRICWNTNGWRKPSGSAEETGGSFVAINGFGHEEWLFNYEWCLDGYKFAFLEPFRKTRESYEGQTIAAALCTKVPGKGRKHALFVGIIRKLYFPTHDELRQAFNKMKARKWLEQMRGDVAAVDGKLTVLANPKPEHIINVRFRPTDVIRFDPMPVFPQEHIAARNKRYLANDWDGHSLPAGIKPSAEVNKRSELQKLRAAQQATTIDPKHARLQNQLYDSLCRRHGKDVVDYEVNCVDLKVREKNGDVFYEIKTDSTAKQCIRSAIGQLFEYSTYPDTSRAARWVVVGDAPATSEDIRYLKHLRNEFSLPLHYARFDWETGDIGELI